MEGFQSEIARLKAQIRSRDSDISKIMDDFDRQTKNRRLLDEDIKKKTTEDEQRHSTEIQSLINQNARRAKILNTY